MSKKHTYFTKAKKMYVEEQKSIDRISSELNLNFKTILSWKQQGDWEEKRASYITNRQMFHEELYDFARELMNGIRQDLNKGEKVEQSRIYAFTRMLPAIIKDKEYQEATNKKQIDEDKTSLTPEDMREIEEILGLRRRPKES